MKEEEEISSEDEEEWSSESEDDDDDDDDELCQAKWRFEKRDRLYHFEPHDRVSGKAHNHATEKWKVRKTKRHPLFPGGNHEPGRLINRFLI